MKIEELEKELKYRNADFEMIRHERPLRSRKDASAYFRIEEMVPVLIIRAGKDFLALLISGESKKADLVIIGGLLGIPKVEMARETEITGTLNLIPGQIPLVGHNLPCIVDNRILQHKYIYGGTGDLYHTLKISTDSLIKINKVILTFDSIN